MSQKEKVDNNRNCTSTNSIIIPCISKSESTRQESPNSHNILIPSSLTNSLKGSSEENVDKNHNEDHGHGIVQRYFPRPLQKYAGMIFTLTASLLFSLAVLIVKILNAPEYGFHSYSSSFWRYCGIFFPAIPIVICCERQKKSKGRESVFATVWPIRGFKQDSEKWKTIFGLGIRGLLGASSVILRYFALEYLSIGDTSVITYATPVLVTVLAHFFLGEKSGVVPFLIAIITLCGVIVITRPPFLTGKESFDQDNLIGIGLACGSLVCSSLIVIITRKIRKVHFSLMTLVFGAIGFTQAFTLTQIFQVFRAPTNLIQVLYILGLMCLSLFGQMSIILALTCEMAGPVSLLRSCDVIFGFILQFVFLGVIPDPMSAIGAIIVIFCITLTGLRKWISSLPDEDCKKRKFRYLLF